MTAYPNNSAVVLLSGGQDSATALLWAKQCFDQLYAITIHYGQRHQCEIGYAHRFAKTQGVEHTMVNMEWLGALLGSALGNHKQPIATNGGYQDLPTTFVPGRNLIMLSIAASIGAARGIHHVVAGMCETDYAGYPDCRRPFIDSFQTTFGLAINGAVNVHTPLMNLDKAQTWALADQFGAVGDIVHNTMTCYEGVETLWIWGRGCRVCPACQLRMNGYAKWRGVDISQFKPIAELKVNQERYAKLREADLAPSRASDGLT